MCTFLFSKNTLPEKEKPQKTLAAMSGDSESDMGEMVTSFQAKSLSKTCAWCKNCKSLLSGKPYCSDCSEKMYKECSRCHLPYPEMKYFKLDKQRCNTCQKKYLIEREKRLQKLREQKTHPKRPQTEVTKSIKIPRRKAAKRCLESDSDCDGFEEEDESMTTTVMDMIKHTDAKKRGKRNVIFII